MTKQSSLQIFEEKKVRTVWDDKKGLFNIQTFEMFEAICQPRRKNLFANGLNNTHRNCKRCGIIK